MSKFPDALWLHVSPALARFDRPLLSHLSEYGAIARWHYHQTLDEPTSLDAALVLLHDYLKSSDRPLHLLGHSTGGLLGLLYAHRYPERVRSLTLLSVGVYPGVDWQAHYYIQRQMLLLPRDVVLTQMVYNLFGCHCPLMVRRLIPVLKQDLISLIAKTCYLWVQTIFGKLNKVSCDRVEISSSPRVNLLGIMNKHFGSIKTLIYLRVGIAHPP